MTKSSDALANRLSRSQEIMLSVTGRKSGRQISNPVWFVFENDKLYLLPARGSDTQWYKNVLKNSSIRIAAGSARAELNVVPVSDAKRVKPVIEMFRSKYGDSGIRLYKKLDVAVIGRIAS